MASRSKCTVLFALFALSSALYSVRADLDYRDALYKSILFFEQQRSGWLPGDQRATWRSNSGVNDGQDVGHDLTGGYYDAGDNVKFGFPMAYATTMLAWGVVDYRSQLESAGQLQFAMAAVKWATDYFMKAHTAPYEFYGQVGEGYADHSCWMRPEDVEFRKSFKIDTSNPGSDLAAETAAALAAASIVFRSYNPSYSTQLLGHAKQMFDFADRYRGVYTGSIPANGFYGSQGYNDELLWGAVWLHKATGDDGYLQYVINNVWSLGGLTPQICTYWENKYGALQVLLGKLHISNKKPQYGNVLGMYKAKADSFMCSLLRMNPDGSLQTPRTPGGLIYCDIWSPNQYVATSTLVMSVYADALKDAGQNLQCGGSTVIPDSMHDFVRNQVNYVLGYNPIGRSYLVGFGNFPQRVHHRGSSLPSIQSYPNTINCGEGWNYYNSYGSNPNVLVGAFVGGPDGNDGFQDDRTNYRTNEPIMYLNAPFVGVLARISGGYTRPQVPQVPPSKGRHPPGTGGHRWRPPSAGTPPFQKREVLLRTDQAGTWSSNGKSYIKYNVVITNMTKRTVSNIMMRVRKYRAVSLEGATISKKNTRCFVPENYAKLRFKASYSFTYTVERGSPTMDLKIIAYKAVK